MTSTHKLVALHRVRQHISQNELAKRAGVVHATVSRYESGAKKVLRDTEEALIDGLDLGPEQKDNLLTSTRIAPEWATDITIRQVAFLLRSYPGPRRRRFRLAIKRLVESYCSEVPTHKDLKYG